MDYLILSPPPQRNIHTNQTVTPTPVDDGGDEDSGEASSTTSAHQRKPGGWFYSITTIKEAILHSKQCAAPNKALSNEAATPSPVPSPIPEEHSRLKLPRVPRNPNPSSFGHMELDIFFWFSAFEC
ncbi:hypothetical protein Salat_1173000 [Sesamum alatum]|uniref:Uncharacterized protein n=1 Tax=Sesamum alatum TaxID=300844 RepID=A0AAE1YF63_9LAMI|nr:hypothetical protein Salat_1173000 [Sesamum alatum]